MKHAYIVKRLFLAVTAFFIGSTLTYGQQLPDPSFEDWSGAKFDGNIQPKHWHFSNVEQLGIKFTLSHQEKGHTGNYSMMVQCTEVGAMGITEAAPGYISLGQPWQCLPSITEIKKATAGTSGGINWTYRPDSVQVWVKRTGNSTDKEDFHILYYAWNGTAKGSSYKGKDNSCTSYNATDEESDIRQALDKNECTTTQFANQVAEAWHRARAKYDDWTCLTIPVYYFNDEVPTKCNVIFSASNYPNFRANGGLYVGNSLYVDDIKMIYSSKIQKLYIGNKEWKGFDPNSSEEQVYSLGNNPSIPDIYAMRGSGTLTNAHGGSATFVGRKLSGNEISIQKGEIDGAPTIITVKAEDGSSTSTYKIKFISKPSDNARLASIQVNGENLSGYNGYVTSYNVSLPYGTTAAPVVTFTKAEDAQVVTCTQATSPTGKATISVTAADGTTKNTYTLNFSVALLADNTLKDILIDGTSLPGFKPEYTTYNRVELPLGTTTVPKIEAVSAYPAGAQTIKHTAPTVIDGGQYQIAVSTPGNPTAKVYKLNFKITASTNTLLNNLGVTGYTIDFDPEMTTYYVTLPMGTTVVPEITYEKGDKWQTVTVENDGVNGTSRVTVTAASGDQRVYKIVFNTLQSEVNWLENIYLDGVALDGFARDKYTYEYQLPIGTTTLPVITYDTGDAYQTVEVKSDGVNGTTRITVKAGNGSTAVYQIKFSVLKANNANLQMIYVDGKALQDFSPTTLEYTVNLPQGTTTVPTITYDKGDEWQTVTYRAATSLTGESKITVRPQEGSSQTYIIRFTVSTSANTNLQMIYVDGEALEDFAADKLDYSITLPMGVSTIPAVTFTKAEDVQRVVAQLDGTTYRLTVTAENRAQKTYTISFIVQKSQNAFLNMIYLDGVPLADFDSTKLTGYTVELTGDKCPEITVDKAAGQQVSIIAPYFTGEARITVQPEAGAANTYVILFIEAVSAEVQLKNILLDGKALAGFAANKYNYDLTYTDSLPTITFEKASAAQTVTLLRDKQTITLLVQDGELSNTYTLHFTPLYSDDATLKSIFLDGTPLAGFVPTQLTYTIPVAAGGKVPVVTYEKNSKVQSVVAGALSDTQYQLHVMPERGEAVNYVLTFDKAQYTDATLSNLLLDGVQIEGFAADKTDYTRTIDKGLPLPTITYVKRDGQTVLLAQTSETQQQVIVVAESGAQETYTVNYTHRFSSNAHLKDILVDGKSLAGFAPEKYDYVDSLAWRTPVVPVLNPVAGIEGQTITTTYSSVNGVTTIDVVAPDGAGKATYSIAFPVRKSATTTLENIRIANMDAFEFDSLTNDYVLTLDASTQAAPLLSCEAKEIEQRIDYIAAPLGDTTKVIVTAENGDRRVYRFFFHYPFPTDANRLTGISVNNVAVDMADVQEIDENNFLLTVDMPYGTDKFTVGCETAYAEQTYFLNPGGTQYPTVITLKSNRAGEADVTYTIRPNIAQQNPAHLTSISVNGTPIADFDPNRYSYIVNLDNANAVPNVTTSAVAGVHVSAAIPTNASWNAVVQSGGYQNVYQIYFHYPNDVIPNGEFTQWTTATYNNAPKPSGWNVISDAAEGGTNGQEVANVDNNIVHLAARYWAGPGGDVPAYITLGKVSGGWGIAGSNVFKVEGGLDFHNTPDVLSINYKIDQIMDEADRKTHFVYELWGAGGSYTLEHSDANTIGNYTTLNLNLTAANQKVKIPTQMNIILNAYSQETGKTGTWGTIFGGQKTMMYIDWVRFVYNSQLKSVSFGDETLTPSATNSFSYDFTDPTENTQPALTFVGEVSDQAQKVVWSEETKQGEKAVRTATITNYAEDGTSTEYTLTLTRPLSQTNTLADIQVNNAMLAGFNKDVTDYTYPLAYTDLLPDVEIMAATTQQKVETTFTGETMQITVTPEYGQAKVYTITFVRTKSSDTTLKALKAMGVGFSPETRTYEVVADRMPAIEFEKAHDRQKVEVRGGVVTVTAEDGTVGTYTILLKPAAKQTSGKLSTLQADGNDLKGFSPDVTTYTLEKPATGNFVKPQTTAFVRKDITDSVVHVIKATGMQWTVKGTEATTTYTLTYPTDPSKDVDLQGILLNDEALADFEPTVSDYEIQTDDVVTLTLQIKAGQTYTIRYANDAFEINVTAENGTKRANPYRIKILPELSDVATLDMIYLDGVVLPNFHADSLTYTVELPCANPKTIEPQMPSITYALGQASQTVQVEASELGGTSYLMVTSEQGDSVRTYELTIKAEPSHNATLNNILVNGVLVNGFEPERYWYSAQTTGEEITLQYSSDDAFQTVVEKRGADGEYILEVTAQDGVTKHSYFIELWKQTMSNNAYLKDVLIDGKPFSAYDATSSDFSAKQLFYNIRIPESSSLLPDLYVALAEDGQRWERLSGEDVDTIRVTAPDGVTINDYVINFLRVKSSNANLQSILLDGEPLANFDAAQTIYTINIPVGVKDLPIVDPRPGDNTQTVNLVTEGTTTQIIVTAEDGTEKSYWLIFNYLLSDADTLAMLYEDGIEMAQFDAHTFYYDSTLQVGVRTFPYLEFDAADAWQTITVDTISTDMRMTYQINVVAENGKKNVYTVVYNLQQSSVDTLKMIYVDNQDLEGFVATQTDYTIWLPIGTTQLPTVTLELGDEYQTIDSTWVDNTCKLTVRAENGAVRIYSVTFITALSNNAQLKLIQVAGKPIELFDGEVLNYDVALPYGTATIPAITFTKAEDAQNVSMALSDWTATVTVQAADGVTTQVYTINFTVNRSANAELLLIRLDGKALDSFQPAQTEYDITLPYGTEQLPAITWQTADEQQTVVLDTLSTTEFMLTVTSGNQEATTEYIIRFRFEKSAVNTLSNLALDGKTIKDFAPETNEYYFTFESGTSLSQLYTIDDITYTLTDTTAIATLVAQDVYTLTIVVTAANGESNAYIIHQEILLPDNAFLADLMLDGVTIEGFDSALFQYEYELLEGGIMPIITAVAADSLAEVSITPGNIGDTIFIYCTAQDGTEYTYTVHVHYSSLNTVANATAQDVILKHIPGTNQYIAATTRQGVQILILNLAGQKILLENVPICDPNSVNVTLDKNGQELLTDVDVNSPGAIITIDNYNTPFFYVFLQNEKNRITAGKIMITR